jgi:DNA modification methylase
MLASKDRILLTVANIRNNYIRIRQFNNLIPENTKTSGVDILLELEGVGQVKTRVDRKKGILAERKAIRHFFQLHGLKPGDEVALEKMGERQFRITASCKKQQMLDSSTSNQPDEQVEIQTPGKDQLLLFQAEKGGVQGQKATRAPNLRRANELSGKEWTALSISVWKDIRKTADEMHLDHPAMFPIMLVKRVIQCFTTSSERMILDPFMGSGSTLVGACLLGRKGIGFEIYPDYVELAKQRLSVCTRDGSSGSFVIHPHDAIKLGEFVEPSSIDFCFTSPPYWNILTQRRTADYKEVRNYGDSERDLGRKHSYTDFLESLGRIFYEVLKVLKPGKYCVVNVMDLRKRNRFYPFHSDLARMLEKVGYIFDDIIIWDRSHEYNNLRPLGYPAVFRINKVHEYLLIFQKPS